MTDNRLSLEESWEDVQQYHIEEPVYNDQGEVCDYVVTSELRAFWAGQKILDLPLPQPNATGTATIRDFLINLLHELWEYGEDFNTKRPFGNSDWQYEIYRVLQIAGYNIGLLDENGYFEDVDMRVADNLIHLAIDALYG